MCHLSPPLVYSGQIGASKILCPVDCIQSLRHTSPGSDPNKECTMWTGSMNHIMLDNTTDTGSDSSDSEGDIEELDGEELLIL